MRHGRPHEYVFLSLSCVLEENCSSTSLRPNISLKKTQQRSCDKSSLPSSIVMLRASVTEIWNLRTFFSRTKKTFLRSNWLILGWRRSWVKTSSWVSLMELLTTLLPRCCEEGTLSLVITGPWEFSYTSLSAEGRHLEERPILKYWRMLLKASFTSSTHRFSIVRNKWGTLFLNCLWEILERGTLQNKHMNIHGSRKKWVK